MSIQPIMPNMQTAAMSSASPVVGGRYDGQLSGALGGVANLLHMSSDQLRTSLASGSDLSSLASSAGVSEKQLTDTIKQGLTNAGSQLTGTRLDNIASRIAHHHRMHHAPVGAASSSNTSAASGSTASSWAAATSTAQKNV